jgi:hypothetical protein
MNKTFTILFLLVCSLAFGQSQTKKVLFLGNSYTYVNNLPQMIVDVANSTGDVLIFDNNTIGGYKLIEHSTNTVSVNKIKTGGWDYVVLQEQSQIPAIDYDQFYNGAFPLNTLVKQYNPCSETMLYMTWGRKNGDPLNCPYIPEMCTYNGMDSLLSLAYKQMALDINGIISPVGAVRKYLRENYPNINLYQSDESHPSVEGTYAAACCFYAAVFRKDPTLISFNPSITTTDAANIRNAAKLITYDSLLNWHIGEYDSLVNAHCSVAGIKEQRQDLTWQIFPNPAIETLTIKINNSYSKENIQIFNAIGILIKDEEITTKQIDISDLPKGIYFVGLKNHKENMQKFIKQ